VIPICVSNPELIVRVGVITVKDQLERTVKTLHKAVTLHTEISKELEASIHTSPKKELHTTKDPLTPIDDTIIYVQTGKHTFLEDNKKPFYSGPFRESDMPDSSVAVYWN